MNADSFKLVLSATIVEPLTHFGFVRVGNQLHLERHNSILTLLFFGGRGSGIHRYWDVSIGIRHRFLRRLIDQEVISDFQFEVNDYPVKICPIRERELTPATWRYSTRLLGFDGGGIDSVFYGDDQTEELVLEHLETIRTTITGLGMDLMRKLTPCVMLEAIRENNKGAWCEKLWMEDYAGFLNGCSDVGK